MLFLHIHLSGDYFAITIEKRVILAQDSRNLAFGCWFRALALLLSCARRCGGCPNQTSFMNENGMHAGMMRSLVLLAAARVVFVVFKDFSDSMTSSFGVKENVERRNKQELLCRKRGIIPVKFMHPKHGLTIPAFL